MTGARRVLGGRYELGSLLATGGMGQVWCARDTLLHRPVAVKVLRSEFTGDPTFLARFRAEAQHAAALDHPNIATVFDYGEATAADGGEHLAYLVMELVEGESLSALLSREGRLDAARTLEVLHGTAGALAAAHRSGVVHRDVKPGNVLLARDGTVRITDFGIAWSASSVPLTRTGQVVGTAHYLSPEQAAGSRAGPASDVYALGLIGYECLAGRRAFDGENSVQIALSQLRDVPDPLPADVPGNVRTLIERALVKDPADRFPDGAAFRDAVADVRAGRTLAPAPTPAHPVTRTFTAPGPGTARSRGRARLLVPAAALAAGVGLGVAVLQGFAAPAPAAPVAADTAPEAILLTAEDYLGRPVAEVEADLGALGLRVGRVAVRTDEVAPGTVTSVGPSGAVRPGELITVGYAVSAPAEVGPGPQGPVPPPAGTSTSAVDTLVPELPPAGSETIAGTAGNANGRGGPGGGQGNGTSGDDRAGDGTPGNSGKSGNSGNGNGGGNR